MPCFQVLVAAIGAMVITSAPAVSEQRGGGDVEKKNVASAHAPVGNDHLARSGISVHVSTRSMDLDHEIEHHNYTSITNALNEPNQNADAGRADANAVLGSGP